MVKGKVEAFRGADNKIRLKGAVGSHSTLVKEPIQLKGLDINNIKIKSPKSSNTKFYSKISKMVGAYHLEDFKLLEQGLKDSGWLDDTNPILKFTTDGDLDEIIISLNTTVKSWMFLFSPYSGKIEHLDNNNYLPAFLRQIAEKRWGKAHQKFGNLAINETLGEKLKKKSKVKHEWFWTSVQDTLWLFDEGLKFITDEITKQGYKPDNKKIANLIELTKCDSDELAGGLKDWIPYVDSGLDVKNLLKILNKKNNPNYDKTGEFSTSLETMKKMSSIHSSFSSELLK